uniref:Phospholipase A2 n=1 Tax=Myripristis murdjan TaxID=586833 RepID=A0A668A207_9TELE
MNLPRYLLVLSVCVPGCKYSKLHAVLLITLTFRSLIICMMPDSWPLRDYADYGCYCGLGGSGTPVDDLDGCCQIHDKCYGDAMKYDECLSVFHNPYTKTYSYDCDRANMNATCLSDNSLCEMFICNCDRSAAMCFAKAGYNPEYKHYPSELCK